MQTDRTTSRRALALIQIWASEAMLPLSHVPGSLSHSSRPYPGAVLRLRERRRFSLRSLVRTIVSWLSRLSLSTQRVSTQP